MGGFGRKRVCIRLGCALTRDLGYQSTFTSKLPRSRFMRLDTPAKARYLSSDNNLSLD
jgi:hypothetical protein